MNLPARLERAIEEELKSQSKKGLSLAQEQLSENYRQGKGTRKVNKFAYLVSRMPATFAAVSKVLEEVQKRVKGLSIKSVLDLGSGPGTALWAAHETFPMLQTATALEQDKDLLRIGKSLGVSLPISVLWKEEDLEKVETLSPHDLAIFSYSVGELSEKTREKLIKLAAQAAKVIVVIEPGTPAGFERIRKIRYDLIQLGKEMIAPCPHHLPCPMKDGDWCHFAARLSRTSLHREIKGGTLGHEDEKFSYVAFTNTPVPLPEARIIRHPQKRKGHIHFTLCTKTEGLQDKVISKRTPEFYKEAKALEWGDSITIPQNKI